jgi:hypothetical protein
VTGAPLVGRSIGAGKNSNNDYSTSLGLGTIAAVDDSGGGNHFPFVAIPGSGVIQAGDYWELPWCSVARCLLVDNGPNLFTYSDQFDNAIWSKTAVTVSQDTGATTAPDGTSTADNIVETATTNFHYTAQVTSISASAKDYCLTVALKTNGRSYAWLQLSTSTGVVLVYFSLVDGSVTSQTTGAGWSNLRAFPGVSLGNGWYQITVVARKTSADTSLTSYIGAAAVSGTASYAGNTGFGMFNWRATLAQSSVPVKLSQTTSAATSGTSQTGSGIYVKGGPASAAGSLLAGDLVQIGSQLQQVVAPVNFDASGLGYLQMHRPLRSAPADNAPVIINNPMGKFIVSDNENGLEDAPGNVSNVELQFEEDVYS